MQTFVGRANKVLIKVVHAPLHPKGFICCLAYIDKADNKKSGTITNNNLNETLQTVIISVQNVKRPLS